MNLEDTWRADLRAPSLRERVFWTVPLVLLFRLLTVIPVLNVDEDRLTELLAGNPLLGTIDLFAGGEVLTHFSVVAAGIFPYLLALILVKGATWVVPSFRELQREGERGKKRLERYARIATIPLAFAFAWGLSQYLSQQTGLFPGRIHWFTSAGFFPTAKIVGLVTLGSLASTWITSLITKKGVGSGEGVVLVVGSSLGFVRQLQAIVPGTPGPTVAIHRLVFAGIVGLMVVVFSIYQVKAVRRVPVQFAKIRKSPIPSYLPLLLNRGGLLPVSSAIGVLTLVQFARNFLLAHFGGGPAAVGRGLSALTAPGSGWYWVTLAGLIVLFTYICNFSMLWQPPSNKDLSLAEQLKRAGSYIPGVRPGSQTEEYLSRIMTRITLPAGLGLALLAAGLPYAILQLTQQNVLVAVLSVIVFVQTLEGLRDEVRAYALVGEYKGFLGSRKRRRQ